MSLVVYELCVRPCLHLLCHKIRFPIYFGYISLYFRSSCALGFPRLKRIANTEVNQTTKM